MTELKTISIDGKDYSVENFTEQQKIFLAQIGDIDKKFYDFQFQCQQLSVAKDAFVNLLKQSLEENQTSE